MALKKTVDFRGLQIMDAYLKIELTTIRSGNQDMEVRLGYWMPDKASQFHAEKFTCPYELNGDNPIAQAYLHLKSLDAFAGAEDC